MVIIINNLTTLYSSNLTSYLPPPVSIWSYMLAVWCALCLPWQFLIFCIWTDAQMIILVTRYPFFFWHTILASSQTYYLHFHYCDIIMSTMASQITSPTIVCSNVYSGADQRKHQSSASLAFVRGIHLWLVNSSHKGSVTQKMFPFGDAFMFTIYIV